MRLSALVSVLLLTSATIFAQHSSAGGGSSGGSSVGSGGYSGGSHSGSGGSYSSGGGSYSGSRGGGGSGGSSSPGRSSGGSHNSSRGASNGNALSRSIHNSPTGLGPGSTKATVHPEKRSFFSALRHPFKKHASKTRIADWRQPPCRKKPCPAVCPPGTTGGRRNACSANAVVSCPFGEAWNGVACQQTFRFNNCDELNRRLSQQGQILLATESSRQTACSIDAASQECSDSTARYQNETLGFRSLRQQLEQCQQRFFSSFGGVDPLGSSSFSRP